MPKFRYKPAHSPTLLSEDQESEIAVLRAQRYETSRPTVPALEAILHQALPMLDRGFIRVVDYMGDDAAIVQAARVSYGKGTRRVQDDAGLIRYLMRHRHSTPFEMCEIKYHIKLPIFIARQWIRHRTASINEYSARYSVLDNEFYIPDPQHMAAQSATNRQGRGDVLSDVETTRVIELLRDDAVRNYGHYLEILNEDQNGVIIDPDRRGLARELARMNLTLNTYTQWYWKVNLHNLFHFLGLRADHHAQHEIRVYADKMLDICMDWVPLATQAFLEYRKNAMTLSATMVKVVQKLIAGETVTQKESGLNKREWEELMETFSPPERKPHLVHT